ncbi:transcription termination factor 2-like [Gordionus sp. m RMFG-2023]|uniref:transcription termination factor 2-like n=1 Tax=Gordionus sp. m RMFG-2023 TaxID=3053472 RepID=UPI0031FCB9C0
MYHNVILSEESFTEISKENFKSNIDKYFGEKVNVNKIDLIDLTHCNHSNSLKDISVINLSCSSVDEPINLESFDNNLTDSLDNGKDIGYKDEIKIYPTKNNTAKDILKQTTANPSYNQLTSNNFKSVNTLLNEDLKDVQILIEKIIKILSISNLSLPDKGSKLKIKLAEMRNKEKNLKEKISNQITQNMDNMNHFGNKIKTMEIVKSENSNLFKNPSLESANFLIQLSDHDFNIELQAINENERSAFERLMTCLKMEKTILNEKGQDENSNNCDVKSAVKEICSKLIKVPLKPHQITALIWMLNREKVCLNPKTESGTGGILADDMGLGKTLTTIALILVSHYIAINNIDILNYNARNNLYEDPSGFLESKCQGKNRSDPTLVVCPASLIHQWDEEIKKYCVNQLKVLIYHGNNRTQRVHHIVNHDIIITTFSLAGRETSSPSVLSSISWQRLILDEAHVIKNPKSQTTQSLYIINSRFRWALTGTPIHNKLTDIYSLIRFLRVIPFDKFSTWKHLFGENTDNKSNRNNYLSNITSKNIERQKSRLHLLLKVICLRRIKNQKNELGEEIIHLPTKSYEIYKLELSPIESKIYAKILLLSRRIYEQMIRDNLNKAQPLSTRRRNQTNVLVHLLRMRQCCCHPSLLKNTLQEADLETEGLSPISKSEKSDVDSNSLFTIDNLEKALGTLSFCDKAANNYITPNIIKLEDNFDCALDPSFISTKIGAILNLTHSLIKKTMSIKNKCVIVSQWTSFLNLLANNFKSNGEKISYHILTGNSTPLERIRMVRDFNENPYGSPILLLSLKAGGVGLNLIGGNHVIFTDPHWNPALENQACDRIHRMGQCRPVFAHRFVCRNTVEERIIDLQNDKLRLAKSTLDTPQGNHRDTLEINIGENRGSKLGMDDIKKLLC